MSKSLPLLSVDKLPIWVLYYYCHHHPSSSNQEIKMTISSSATEIFCQRCGKPHLLSDTTKRREFTSISFPRSVFASPFEISSAAEDMIFCPSCFLEDRDRSLDDFSLFLKEEDKRVDPDGLDKEKASKGDATVTHTPPHI